MKDRLFETNHIDLLSVLLLLIYYFLEYSSGILEIKENMDSAELQEKLNQSKSFLVFNKE